eukprot:734840-Prorocentrum_minimum.AAC.1
MWPPKEGSKIAASLERCVRVFPHLQNTGGFFIALVKKVRAWPGPRESKRSATSVDDDDSADDDKRRRRRRGAGGAQVGERMSAGAGALRAAAKALRLLPGSVGFPGE